MAAAAPLVSVVLPTYNRAAMLGRAIASVLAQTYRTLELIVVDDGSTDATEGTVRQFDDPRVRYLRRERGGPSAARNAGVAIARGSHVAFHDSDDEWLPEKLAKQMAAMAAAGPATGLVVCGHSNRNAPPDSYDEWLSDEHLERGDAMASLLTGLYFPTPTWLLRRAELDRAGGFDEALPSCEDWDLAFRLADICGFRCVPEVLVIKHHDRDGVFGTAWRRVAGVERILQRHGHRWRSARRWHAWHEYRLGYWFIVDTRQRLRGWRHLLRAVVLDPAEHLVPVARMFRLGVRGRTLAALRRVGLGR